MAIADFKHKGLKELFLKGATGRVGVRYHDNILLILDHLNAATDLKDCNGVKNFHELGGDRQGTYSMHVNGNYCVTFKWRDGEAYDVDFEDYH